MVHLFLEDNSSIALLLRGSALKQPISSVQVQMGSQPSTWWRRRCQAMASLRHRQSPALESTRWRAPSTSSWLPWVTPATLLTVCMHAKGHSTTVS